MLHSTVILALGIRKKIAVIKYQISNSNIKFDLALLLRVTKQCDFVYQLGNHVELGSIRHSLRAQRVTHTAHVFVVVVHCERHWIP